MLGASLALGCAAPAQALDPGKALTQYVLDVWQIEQGLPQNSVQAIAQTRDGYLWIGTSEGLARFDGLRFTVFDKGQLPVSNVHALREDRQGNLWIGTYGGGLSVYRDGVFKSYGRKDGLSDENVRVLFEDQAGSLWIGTQAGGVMRFRGGSFSVFGTAEGLANRTVRAICEDALGRLWVGTRGGGLSRLDGERFIAYGIGVGRLVPYVADAVSMRDSVLALHRGRDGALWIGTETRGLLRLAGERLTPYATRGGTAVDHVRAVVEDVDGNVWAGTDAGLHRLRGQGATGLTARDGLTNDVVLALFEDREKSLWVGTRDGLTRLRDGKFVVLTRKEGLSHDFANTVYQDRAGVVWIGTRMGLNRVSDGRTIRVLTQKQGLSSDFVTALHEDRQGALWVGTFQGGLNRLSGGVTHYTTRDGLANDAVTAIVSAREGGLWIGTHGGLSRFERGSLRSLGVKEGLASPVVLALHEDGQGRLWIGGAPGLSVLQDGKLRDYSAREPRLRGDVAAIHEDRAGTLWFGSSKGLVCFRNGRFSSYGRSQGLPSAVVLQILEDARGDLWLTSPHGVFRVAKADLDAVDAGTSKLVTTRAYGRADGMKSSECSGNVQPAGFKTRDGRLWLPTVKGVAVIDPDHIKVNAEKPPVVIEDIRVDEKPIALLAGVELAAGTQKFEFHYAALSLVASDRVSYRYRLEGFDPDWIDAGARRVAYYNSIPPGAYRFRVRACNADGACNEDGAVFAFTRRARFQETWWFGGLGALALASLGFGVYRLRLRQVKAEFDAVLAERVRIGREIHDTLAQGFVGISAQLETVAKLHSVSPELARKHLDRARILVRSSLVEARRSVWDLRPQALERGDLASAFADIAQQLTTGTEVRVDVLGQPRRLPPHVENNLFRIGQEALTNAFKHAQAGAIRVELRFDEETVRLAVNDDGRGFDTQAVLAAEGHFGLVGIRERTQILGGRLSVLSSAGAGSWIVVEVAVPRGPRDRALGAVEGAQPLRAGR